MNPTSTVNNTSFRKDSVNNRSKDKIRRTNTVLLSLIKEKGFRTIQSFADSIGVTRSYLSQVIHGHIDLDDDMKITIAKKLGVDSRTIFKEK